LHHEFALLQYVLTDSGDHSATTCVTAAMATATKQLDVLNVTVLAGQDKTAINL
jgi:hypothetical protein